MHPNRPGIPSFPAKEGGYRRRLVRSATQERRCVELTVIRFQEGILLIGIQLLMLGSRLCRSCGNLAPALRIAHVRGTIESRIIQGHLGVDPWL